MRIQEKPLREYPWYLRLLFRGHEKKYGQVLKPALLWGRVPRLLTAVSFLYAMLDNSRSSLSPILRSLVTVRVSQINWCHFCIDINSSTLAMRCGSMEKLHSLANWRESTLFDEMEKQVLDYTEAMTYTERRVTDEQFTALKKLFTDEAIIELTGLIAFQNMSCNFNCALDIPAQGFCVSKMENGF